MVPRPSIVSFAVNRPRPRPTCRSTQSHSPSPQSSRRAPPCRGRQTSPDRRAGSAGPPAGSSSPPPHRLGPSVLVSVRSLRFRSRFLSGRQSATAAFQRTGQRRGRGQRREDTARFEESGQISAPDACHRPPVTRPPSARSSEGHNLSVHAAIQSRTRSPGPIISRGCGFPVLISVAGPLLARLRSSARPA